MGRELELGMQLGLMVWGLGFGVWGLGLGVRGLGFRVQGSGFMVEGVGGTCGPVIFLPKRYASFAHVA